MFSLTGSQVILKEKLVLLPRNYLTTRFPGSNFLLSNFSVGSKRDFQVADLPLAIVNFKLCFITTPFHEQENLSDSA